MTTDAAPEGPELEELIARIESASAGVARPLDVRERLGVTAEENRTPAAAVDAAFLYIEPGGRDTKHKLTEYFGPIAEFGNFVNPPRVADMPAWVPETWALCADRVSAHVARDRLHDLCFCARVGNAVDHVRAAVEAYIGLADNYPSADAEESARIQVALGAGHDLSRGLELVRALHQDDLAEQVLDKLVELAGRSMDDPDAGPGTVLGFIAPLIHDPSNRPEVDDLVSQARELYRNDMWSTLSIIELELARPGVTAEDRERMRRQEVEALMREAESAAQPLLALRHLQDAAERAQRHQLGDLYEAVVLRMQAYAGTDLGLVKHEVSFEIPAEMVEGFLNQFTDAPSWQDALCVLIAGDPPSGRVEQNRSTVAELPTIAPLTSLFGVMQLSSEGLPRFTASTDQEREAHHLADTEIRTMQSIGMLHIEALRRIGEKWEIDPEELTEFLGRNEHVPSPVAVAVAGSFRRFFAEDYEGATFNVVPRIERVARELLLRMGAPIYRPPTAASIGQYSGLGVLLNMLDERGLEESWGRFLGTLLTRAEGLSYRNHLLHGAVDEPTGGMAGLALIAALYLTVGVQAGSRQPSDDA